MNQIDLLLIEDNISDAELTIHVLKKSIQINNLVHLNDGAEALDFIFAEGNYTHRDIKNLPKVILLDLKMPKRNGMEVLIKIKEDKRTKFIPVVILTSSGEDSDIQSCYSLGANSYVIKPVEFEQFVEVISSIGQYWLVWNQKPPMNNICENKILKTTLKESPTSAQAKISLN